MALTTRIKFLINHILSPVNLKLESRTEELAEIDRLAALERAGKLEGAIYPFGIDCRQLDLEWVSDGIGRYSDEVRQLISGDHPAAFGFDPENSYFNSSDAVMLYLMVRQFKPKRFIEVGSGNSTRIVRAALSDSGVAASHVAIDPFPREDIQGLVDQIHRSRLEEIESSDLEDLVDSLESGDMLFIDSSHEVRAGGDLAVIFCRILPRLKSGVIVHFHDIFLPFEYPKDFIYGYPSWGEQYLLQAWLNGAAHKVIWPGFYLQKARPELFETLELGTKRAQSFWLQIAQ